MIRILIVHDDPVTIEALRTGLALRQPRRPQVHVVSSPREAIIKLLQAPYTVLVTDVRFSGFDLVLKVSRLLQPETQTVVISSDHATDDSALAVRLGSDVVLQKPMEREVLVTWLEAVMQRGRERPASADEDLLHMKIMVQAAEALLFMTDPDWSILVFNRAAEAVTGYSAQEVYGKNLLHLLVPSDWQPSITQALPASPKTSQRSPWRTKAGHLAHIDWRYSTVEMADYRGSCVVGVGFPLLEGAGSTSH